MSEGVLRGLLGAGEVPLFDLSAGSVGLFSLRKFIQLYTFELYNFLYVCLTPEKMLRKENGMHPGMS